jgi:integrase/recombinase XerD
LLEEGESDADHLLGLRAPKLDAKVVEPLTAEQIKALVAACAGRDLRDRRDEALVRLMIETGARAGEVVALGTEDVDLATGTATVRRGKGGRGRVVPFGRQTARALDRYLRARRGHRLAGTPALGLGDRGKAFSYDALHRRWASGPTRPGSRGSGRTGCGTPRRTAGSPPTAARAVSCRWPAGRGWTCCCATRAQASARAAAEARALGLGDF